MLRWKTKSERHQCYICLSYNDQKGKADWVSPCKCQGSLEWVHQDCIMTFVRELEKRLPKIAPFCPTCRTPLIIEEVLPGFLERTFRKHANLLSPKVQMNLLQAALAIAFVHVLRLLYVLNKLVPQYTYIFALFADKLAPRVVQDSHLWENVVVLSFMNLCGDLILFRLLQRLTPLEPFLRRILPSYCPPGTIRTSGLHAWGGVLFSLFVYGVAAWSAPWVDSFDKRLIIGGVTFCIVKGILITMYVKSRVKRLSRPRRVLFYCKLKPNKGHSTLPVCSCGR